MRARFHIPLRSYRRSPRWLVSVLCLLWLGMACADAQANTFVVTTLSDSGAGSLRQAITDANANAGADTIAFDSGLTGTIALATALPNLTDDVTLTGPGAKLLTVARSSATGTATFRIFTIDNGTATPPTVSISGLTLANGLIQVPSSYDSQKYYGGAVYSNKANVAFTDCAITGNSVGSPGTLYFYFDPSRPTPSCSGGGIYNKQGIMTLRRCTINNNSVYAQGTGGGVCNEGGTMTLADCTVSGNSVSFRDAGFFSLANTIYGGGIWNSGALNLTGCTFANNSAITVHIPLLGPGSPASVPGSGSSVYNAGGSGSTHVTLYQTILASGSSSGGQNVVSASGIVLTSLGYNLSNDATGPNDGVTDRLNVDAKLSPLADYGGPTPTHVPLLGSPAIDAGDPNFNGDPPTDQRGQPRVVNGQVDIGAVERQAIELVASNDAYSVKHDHTLRVAAPGVLTNDTGVAPLSAVLVTQPAHGTLMFNADGSFVYTPNAGYGVAANSADSFTYKVQDGNGHTSNIATVVITVIADTAPVLTNRLSASAPAGQAWNFTATGTDADLPDDTLTFSLVNALSGMSINGATGAIAYTPKTEGVFTFGITVTDRYGKSDSKTFTLTVSDNHPVLTNSLSATTMPGQVWNFTATATDADLPNDALTFSLVNPPSGMSINGATGVITWTPPTEGVFRFDIKVVDLYGGSDQKTFTLTVFDNPPVLTNGLSATATAGQVWNFTATATDADLPGDTLTFSLVNPPSGMTINGATGAITWTPQTESTTTFGIKVTDRFGKSDQKTFTLTVQSDPNAPVSLSITNVVVQRVNANTVSVSFNVVNNGAGKATNLVIARATLGPWLSVVNSPPVNLGAGGKQAYTLTFSGVASQPKVVYPLQIHGTYQAQNTTQSCSMVAAFSFPDRLPFSVSEGSVKQEHHKNINKDV